MTFAHRKYRNAYTLIEILVVISIMSIVLVSIGAIMHQLVKLNQSIRQTIPDSAAITRLSDRWRADVHAATEFAPGGDGSKFGSATLTSPGGSLVEYRAEPSAIVRLERRDNVQTRREQFRVRALVGATWHAAGDQRLVVMQLTRRIPGSKISGGQETQESISAALDLRNQAEASK